jgi:hypothetical protein
MEVYLSARDVLCAVVVLCLLLGWEGRRAGASFELNGLFQGSGFFLLLDMYASLEAMGNRQLPVLQTYGATTIDNMGEHSLNVPYVKFLQT